MKGRVLIVDDHDLLREGIASFLSHQWEVVGQAGTGQEAIALARSTSPDLVILDISMPALDGLYIASQLRVESPGLCIIFFTQQIGREQLRHAFQLGAKAFVAKQSASRELMMALDVVERGGYYVTPSVYLPELKDMQGKYLSSNPVDLLNAGLTPRQLDVLRLIAAGKSTKEIAAILGISSKTVEFHRNSVADELGIRTTAELTRYALANGIVSL